MCAYIRACGEGTDVVLCYLSNEKYHDIWCIHMPSLDVILDVCTKYEATSIVIVELETTNLLDLDVSYLQYRLNVTYKFCKHFRKFC